MQVFSILSALAVLVGVRLLLAIVSLVRHARKSRRLGCGKAPLYPGRDPFGISTLLEALKADREKLLPELAEKRIELLSRQQNRYITTFRIRQAGRENLFTTDPKNIQALLATQFNDFGLGDMRRNIAEPLVGRGIFTTDGEAWSHSRSLLRPQFTRKQIENLGIEERHVQNAMRAIPMATDKWTPAVDIQTIFFRLTLDSSTEFLFGQSCDSQIAALEHGIGKKSDRFRLSFDQAQWYLAQRLRFEKLYWLGNGQGFHKCIAMVHKFVDQYVHAILKERQEGKFTNVDQYVFLRALAAETQDPLKLRYESLNVLLAGRDTTASLLSWAVLLLARHPDVLQRLRKDILDQFGTYGNPSNLNFRFLKECTYLQYFLHETLRLYPVVPFNRRCAINDTTLPRGGGPDGNSPIYLRKGQPVLYSNYVLQRRKDVWGNDADTFNPDRWHGRRVTWEYVPFNGGPRTCIGQQFALIKTSYVLVRLLQRYDAIEDINTSRKIRYGVTLTSCPADLVTVRMHEAEE